MVRRHKDRETSRWSELRSALAEMFPKMKQWRQREWIIFFEIETIFHLYERLVPADTNRPAAEAWALVSGYCSGTINTEPEAREMCLLLRERLQYIRTASAWKWWLRHWYVELPSEYRLYRFTESLAGFIQQRHEAALGGERLMRYEQVTQLEGTEPTEAPSPLLPAAAGKYAIQIEGSLLTVEISEAMASTFASQAHPTRELPNRVENPPIHVDLESLAQLGQELDVLEAEAEIEPRGNWYIRLSTLEIVLLNTENVPAIQHTLSIEELFHLVGMLGVGKSTLIWALTYQLAAKEHRHITVVLNTVVEAIRLCVWLRKLGVAAAPALGRNREDHARKYGLANAETLSPDRLFRQAADDPVLRWMPVPCALSGSQSVAIPKGKEPCWNLIGEDGKRYRCPLLAVCPVHTISRDLVESTVWVVNPQSFLYSAAPEGIGSQGLRLLEAIYRISDLVIVDEADRVQVQWDDAFAPTQPLAGSSDALLDHLHRELPRFSTGAGRRNAANAAFSRLTKTEAQAHVLSDRVFGLMAHSPAIAKWIANDQITNVGIFNRLLNELMKQVLRSADTKALRDKLRAEFVQYWRNPLRREEGFLADWISRLLGTDERDKRLRHDLERWLADLVGWKVKIPFSRKEYRLLARKLEFCVLITAMIKRANDIIYQLNWIGEDIPDLEAKHFELNESITTLVPDPPLGVVLGVRLVGYVPEQSLGVFHYLRYRGLGRWLLLNFPHLYRDHHGITGPHLLLTSATSWMPGSPQFHLAVQPHAALLTNTPLGKVEILFRSDGTKISGAGRQKERNLRQTIRALAAPQGATPSRLQREVDYWRSRGEYRRLLVVVNSYEQTGWVFEELERIPEWTGRSVRLLPDDDPLCDEGGIHAREAERLHRRDADILIAPLMAIQRGFNILDEDDKALLGTVLFLVRPYPPPEDLGPQVLSMNAWTLSQLKDYQRELADVYSQHGTDAMKHFRNTAYRQWYRRLLGSGRYGVASMNGEFYEEFLRDQFIAVWQTIGRLLRGGRDARVIFIDSAFAEPEGRRRMLRDWYNILSSMVTSTNLRDRQLAVLLYNTAWEAFNNAVNNGEIE